MLMNSPSAQTQAQWDSALSHWESWQADGEVTVQLWPLHSKNTTEALLGANGVWLIPFGATEKENQNLN